MDGLVGYGSDDSENSKNSPAPKNKEKRLSPSSAQLEAEWASFQKLIGGENHSGEQKTKASKIDLDDESSSNNDSDKEDASIKRRRKKGRRSVSPSSGSSGKSDSGSESSDDSSNEESEDDKKERKTEVSTVDVTASKQSDKSALLAEKKRSRSPSSSSGSETEHKVGLGQTAEEANGQPDSGEIKKERRTSHRSSSPRRRSRSRERHRKYRNRRSRSRSQQRHRRKRRIRRSRSRGRRSRSRGKRRRSSKTPERRGSSSVGERGQENHAVGKPGDSRVSRSRSRTPKKRERRRSSRSPRRGKRSGSKNRRRRRSRSPPLRRRRRRRKRRPSRRVSRSRSRSKSPVSHKKRNEPLNYKEQLKQSLLQVQKQAAEGKLNLEELTAKGKDLLTPNEKPSALPLGSENPLVAMAAGQLGHVTPQQALLQTMAAMHQKAQELTGVAVPKYYNPASVNPLKYAEQVQKRKLLWSKNKEKKVEEQHPGVAKPKTQWDGALFSQDQDGKQAEKFRKLMGIKKPDGTLASTSTGEGVEEEQDDSVMKKQQELFSRLDQEYEFARMATHTHRGVGLGFSSLHQYPNK